MLHLGRQAGVELLRTAAALASERPFFLGVGFHKPHLPFYFPTEFGDLYPVETIAPPKHPNPPTEMPLVAWHEGNFQNKWDQPCNDTRPFRRAYYSAVSYTDANIGKLLAELDDLNLAHNTVVAVMGDHGWQLGEMNLWRKMTNFELGVRVPLLIRVPWFASSVGVKTPALVEAVDLFQTFAELSRLGPPPAETQLLQGASLAPLLADPTNTSLHRQFAFSQFAKAMTHSAELEMQVGSRLSRPLCPSVSLFVVRFICTFSSPFLLRVKSDCCKVAKFTCYENEMLVRLLTFVGAYF